ncbi:MAG: hypothetical protein ABI465_11900 [Ktedonobacteraceae bacterium]
MARSQLVSKRRARFIAATADVSACVHDKSRPTLATPLRRNGQHS